VSKQLHFEPPSPAACLRCAPVHACACVHDPFRTLNQNPFRTLNLNPLSMCMSAPR
jgi:hypothetical protein